MKQLQRQQLQQKLSPQQIQLMRLLQLPVTELEQAIKEEIEKNPLLDAEVQDEQPLPQSTDGQSDWDGDEEESFDYDYREHLDNDPNSVRHEFVVRDSVSSVQRLLDQLALKPLSDNQRIIATEIIGTLDDAGYLSRDIALIANDLAFRQGIDTTVDEVEEALHVVQSLDPPGIGARSLQECLLLQIERLMSEYTDNHDSPEYSDLNNAAAIVRSHFDDFAAHRFQHICEELAIDEEQFGRASKIIQHLNPKPAGSSDNDPDTATAVLPDKVLTQHDGQLQFYLNDSHLPRLSLNPYYTDLLHQMEQEKGDRETMQFLRSKQADAQGFISLLNLRHETIVRVMRYIISHQRQYLLTGNPDHLRPMRQREVAEATGLDISTVSRMANSKYLQTDFGTIPLKECFSKGMSTGDGDEVAIETIKQRLNEAISAEDKKAPLSDEALTQMLNKEGLPLARRTVAKYREQLGIPVARLRRILVILLIILSPLSALHAQSYFDSIIAKRLERAETTKNTSEKPKKETPLANVGKKSHGNSTAAPRQKATPPATPEPATTAADITMPENIASYIVPLWYDAFPHNRVNPLGRTRLEMLPDEINLVLITDSSDFCFPVIGRKTSPYGWRWERGHHGVDIGLRIGEPIHAAFGGTVRVAARMGGYGNCIVLRHPNGLETLYGHLSEINVKIGQTVAAGDVIGLGGNTGNSTGPHLHFECRFLYQTFDPEWLLDCEHHTLRTSRLHLDKSYFGIRKPHKGEELDYKADKSIIKEGKKRPKNQITIIDHKDF